MECQKEFNEFLLKTRHGTIIHFKYNDKHSNLRHLHMLTIQIEMIYRRTF